MLTFKKRGGDPYKYVMWLLLLLPSLGNNCYGQISLPKEVKGQPGQFIRVTATTEGKVVKWISLDPTLAVFPSDLLKDSKTTVVLASKPGSYKILAYTSVGDVPTDPVECIIIVGNPGPGPGPGPGPEDELTRDLKNLYISDPNSNKKKDLESLKALYRAIPDYINKSTTAGDLKKLITEGASGMGLSPTALKSLRDRIMVDLNKEIPKDYSAVIDKEKVKKVFAKVLKALEGI